MQSKHRNPKKENMKSKLLNIAILLLSVAVLQANPPPLPDFSSNVPGQRTPLAILKNAPQKLLAQRAGAADNQPNKPANQKSATVQGSVPGSAANPAAAFDAKEGQTFSSLDLPSTRPGEDLLLPGTISFEEADLLQILNFYQTVSGRTVVRSTALPNAKVSVRSQTSLTRREALQAMDSVLAQNGITMIPQGTKFVKAVAQGQAVSEAVPLTDLPPDQLPESASYTAYIVDLKHRKPSQVAAALQPLAKMPNSIIAIDDGDLLILRDYSANIRRMLQVLKRLDQPEKP
jgi:hypothetical protein